MIAIYTNLYMLPVIKEISGNSNSFYGDKEVRRNIDCSRRDALRRYEIFNQLDEEYVREYIDTKPYMTN